jgi:hypothetical protein
MHKWQEVRTNKNETDCRYTSFDSTNTRKRNMRHTNTHRQHIQTQHNAQHSTAQHSTQHNTAQHSTHAHLSKRVQPPARASEQPHALLFGLALESLGARAVAPPPKVVCAQKTPLRDTDVRWAVLQKTQAVDDQVRRDTQ